VSDKYFVYTHPNGEVLVKTHDGTVHESVEAAEAYLNSHKLDILVNALMDDVEKSPKAYFADKNGDLEVSERALLALKTRMRNNATKAFAWYLTNQS
jgi:formylmethanofuran dehydrogenase subunit A